MKKLLLFSLLIICSIPLFINNKEASGYVDGLKTDWSEEVLNPDTLNTNFDLLDAGLDSIVAHIEDSLFAKQSHIGDSVFAKQSHIADSVFTRQSDIADSLFKTQHYSVLIYDVDATNPATIDTLRERNCAKFDPDSDNKILFSVPLTEFTDFGSDKRICLTYAMDSAHSGNVALKLEYYVFTLDADMTKSAYTGSDTQTIDVNNGATVMEINGQLEIANGDISAISQYIEVTLTRDADDGADTHTGNFCLFNIGVATTMAY